VTTALALLSVVTCAVAATAAAAVGLLAANRRDAAGARALAVVMALVAEWCLSTALETMTIDFQAKLVWAKAEYIGITATPLALLVFTGRYTGQDRWLKLPVVAFLSVIPVATLLLDWTDELHGLVHTKRELVQGTLFNSWRVSYGPVFWVNAVYQYAVLAAAVVLGFQALFRRGGVFRRQAVWLMVALVPPWLGNLAFISGLVPLDLTAPGFAVTGIAVGWNLLRGRLLDLIPVARRAVLDSMSTAVLVVDRYSRLVELNPAARRLLGPAGQTATGRDAAEVLVGWPSVTGLRTSDPFTTTDFRIGEGPLGRTFELRSAPLQQEEGPPIGRLILVNDVTERAEAEDERTRLAAEQASRAEAEAARRRVSLLAEISARLAHSLDLTSVLARFKDSVVPAVADGMVLELLESSELGEQVIVKHLTDHGAALLERACPRQTRHPTEVNQPVLLDGVDRLSDIGCDAPQIAAWQELNLRSLMRVPLMVRGRTFGILYLVATSLGRSFQAADLALAEDLADRAALALENVRLYHAARREITERARVESQLEQHAIQRRALADFEHTALGGAAEPILFGDAVTLMHQVIGARLVALVERTNRAQTPLRAVACAGWRDQAADSPPSALLGVAEPGDAPIEIADWNLERRQVRPAALVDHEVRSTVVVPIQLPSHEHAIAWVAAHDSRPNRFSPADLWVMQRVAHILGVAMERKRAEEALHRFATRSAAIQEEERRHVARELHDEIGQQLTGLHLLLGDVASAEPGIQPRLDEARALIGDLLNRVRDLSLELRPTVLDDLGLSPALSWLVTRYSRLTGVGVRLELDDGIGRPPATVETAAYRIVQEALTNVARHARAASASVTVRIEERRLMVQVVDSGCGFDVNQASYWGDTNGLAGMRERAAAAGGSLSVLSQPGAGTRVTAYFPMSAHRPPALGGSVGRER
jgi:signal transduction histidine kinase/PAS domain-containing protein